MTEEIQVVAVPAHLAEELEQALDAIRDEIKTLNPDIQDSDLVLERQTDRGMVGGFGGEVLLYVGGLVATTITKKWIEEVLWIRIKPMVEKHSNEVFDLLGRIPKADGQTGKGT